MLSRSLHSCVRSSSAVVAESTYGGDGVLLHVFSVCMQLASAAKLSPDFIRVIKETFEQQLSDRQNVDASDLPPG